MVCGGGDSSGGASGDGVSSGRWCVVVVLVAVVLAVMV